MEKLNVAIADDNERMLRLLGAIIESDEELNARPQQPLKRNRVVSKALRAYAQSVSSADKGGVRIID